MNSFGLILSILFASFFACREHKGALTLTTTRDYQLAESYFNVRNDSAFIYFNKVATSSKDSLEIAMALNYMAVIQSYEGDYFGSQETLLQSLQYLNQNNERDHNCLMSDYNELGNTSLNLKNYEAAINYYDQALQFTQDENATLIALNGKAVVYQKKRAYPQSIAIYRSILDQSKKNNREYARVLSNFAKVKWLHNPGYNAAPEMALALQIRKGEKDNFGLNASYAHLSEYFSTSHPDSALFYAHKMYAIARYNNSPDDELEALHKLIALSSPIIAKQYVDRYLALNDSIQTTRNSAKNQFALIRYESEKAKTDNLVLQKDNTEKKIQIIKQRVILISGIILFLVIAWLSFIWYRRRKRQMEWQSEKAINEHRLKTSQKVHDVVANGLYRIMTELEHHKIENNDDLLDKVEVLYEKSRDISYEQADSNDPKFGEAVPDLLMSFATSSTKILVKGYNDALWSKLTSPVKTELRHMLQELMVNMRKHSKARNVVIGFERQGNTLKLQYMDDGVGVPSTFQFGNGLRNTENRIKGIGGQIIFDMMTTQGLKILVTIPIQ